MTVFLIALSVIILLFLVIIFLICPSTRKHPDREILCGSFIAHRGLHNKKEGIPENSLSAFVSAAENGFIIENDIHLTADGEVVVFHDDNLKRMCGVDRRISQLTLSEIKQYNLLNTRQKIPTLKECLDEVGGKVPLLIEFKSTNLKCKDLCVAADKILSSYSGKYFIQSFNPFVLNWYKKNRSEVCRGQLAAGFYTDKLHLKLIGALMLNFLAKPDFVAYDIINSGNIFRKLNTLLGALPVGWCFKSNTELMRYKKHYKAYIFENFIPQNKK